MNLIDHLNAIAEADEPITSKDLARCGLAACLLEDLYNACKLLLAMTPKRPVQGLDATFYQTLTYDGDVQIWERIDATLAEYEEKCK